MSAASQPRLAILLDPPLLPDIPEIPALPEIPVGAGHVGLAGLAGLSVLPVLPVLPDIAGVAALVSVAGVAGVADRSGGVDFSGLPDVSGRAARSGLPDFSGLPEAPVSQRRVTKPSRVLPSSKPGQRLWYIAGRAYDLEPWMAKHPGGGDPLRQAQGTDCTELFRAYHLMRAPTAKMLARFEVQVDPSDPQHVDGMRGSHFTFDEGDFYRTIQDRARAYFVDNKLDIHATRAAQFAAVSIVIGAVVLLFPAFVYGSIPAAIAVCFLKIVASVGAGHSMSHFSLFARGPWNILLFRLASPFMISNPAIWSASHIQSHHVHTLTERDMQDNYPLKRVQPSHEHRVWHRAQHVYSWLIYMLGLQLWALQDFVRSGVSIFTSDHSGVYFPMAQRIENFLVIGANIALTIVMPFVFLDWHQALLVWAIVNVPSSFFIVVQIMVNHEVPETMNKVEPGVPIDWGTHQVLTSHNFGLDSTFALHFSGGLNMQIEHHLFPSVHYSHYPALARIVREACVEFELPYNTSSSLGEALVKHYRILRINSVP